MGIDWYRDLIICLSGVVAIVVLIVVGMLALSAYRKIADILNSMKETSAAVSGIASDYERIAEVFDSIREASTAVSGIASDMREEIISPIAQVMAVVQGVRQGINIVGQLFKPSQQVGGEHD